MLLAAPELRPAIASNGSRSCAHDLFPGSIGGFDMEDWKASHACSGAMESRPSSKCATSLSLPLYETCILQRTGCAIILGGLARTRYERHLQSTLSVRHSLRSYCAALVETFPSSVPPYHSRILHHVPMRTCEFNKRNWRAATRMSRCISGWKWYGLSLVCLTFGIQKVSENDGPVAARQVLPFFLVCYVPCSHTRSCLQAGVVSLRGPGRRSKPCDTAMYFRK